MNRVKILLFATLRDYVGSKTIELEISAGTTIHGLTDLLAAKYPRLEKVRDSMMAAINREYAADEAVVPDGAEIAFFPPVSGG
ncbi:MAG: molybdopterin synthase sulfur carrier subunit-like [Anaerolineaceae bacterium]|nr:MAG: molybdopterin synthase sulfur carrier subunit-like [Anaerolineaceae bacterium]